MTWTRHAISFFLILILMPGPTSAIERFELDDNVDLIITKTKPTYLLLTLVNKNDFKVTKVNNIQINFTEDIDPERIIAIDNFENPIDPDLVTTRSITLSFNGTLPALGYGKIFLDIDASPRTPELTTLPTKRPTPKTESPVTPPPTITIPFETSTPKTDPPKGSSFTPSPTVPPEGPDPLKPDLNLSGTTAPLKDLPIETGVSSSLIGLILLMVLIVLAILLLILG